MEVDTFSSSFDGPSSLDGPCPGRYAGGKYGAEKDGNGYGLPIVPPFSTVSGMSMMGWFSFPLFPFSPFSYGAVSSGVHRFRPISHERLPYEGGEEEGKSDDNGPAPQVGEEFTNERYDGVPLIISPHPSLLHPTFCVLGVSIVVVAMVEVVVLSHSVAGNALVLSLPLLMRRAWG